MKALLTTLSIVLITITAHAQLSEEKHKLFETVPLKSTSIYFGIEYSELAQNKYQNIGKDNYTFYVGQRLKGLSNGKTGWRYMIINAELSPEHIQNVNQVGWIEGNRIDLSGTVHAQRLCYDYYPVTIGIGYINKWNKHVLKVNPVLYADLGYNSWGFTNTAYNESYKLNAFTIGGGFRLQSILFDFIVIENPLFDLFTYLTKSRPTMGTIGDTKITRPEYMGIFGWATIGVKFNLNNKG